MRVHTHTAESLIKRTISSCVYIAAKREKKREKMPKNFLYQLARRLVVDAQSDAQAFSLTLSLPNLVPRREKKSSNTHTPLKTRKCIVLRQLFVCSEWRIIEWKFVFLMLFFLTAGSRTVICVVCMDDGYLFGRIYLFEEKREKQIHSIER